MRVPQLRVTGGFERLWETPRCPPGIIRYLVSSDVSDYEFAGTVTNRKHKRQF